MTSKIRDKKKLTEDDNIPSHLKMSDNKTGEAIESETPETKAIAKQDSNKSEPLDLELKDTYFNSLLSYLKKSSSISQFENIAKDFFKNSIKSQHDRVFLELVYKCFMKSAEAKNINELKTILNSFHIYEDASSEDLNKILGIFSDFKSKIIKNNKEYKPKEITKEAPKETEKEEPIVNDNELHDAVFSSLKDLDVILIVNSSSFKELSPDIRLERTNELISNTFDDLKGSYNENELHRMFTDAGIELPEDFEDINLEDSLNKSSKEYNYQPENQQRDIDDIVNNELLTKNAPKQSEENLKKLREKAYTLYQERKNSSFTSSKNSKFAKEFKQFTDQIIKDPTDSKILSNIDNRKIKYGETTNTDRPSTPIEAADIQANYLGTPEMEYGFDKEEEAELEKDPFYQSNASKEEKESNKGYEQIIHDNPAIKKILDNGDSSLVGRSEAKEIKKLISEKDTSGLLNKFNYSDEDVQKYMLDELKDSGLDDSFITKIIIDIVTDLDRSKLFKGNKVEDKELKKGLLSKEGTILNKFKDENSFKSSTAQSVNNEISNHENLLNDIYSGFNGIKSVNNSITIVDTKDAKLSNLQLIESRSGKDVKASIATNISKLLKSVTDESLKSYILELLDYGIPNISKIYTLYNVKNSSGKPFSKILSINPDESSYKDVEQFVRDNLDMSLGNEELFCELYSEITTIFLELNPEASDILGLDTVVIGQFLNTPSLKAIQTLTYDSAIPNEPEEIESETEPSEEDINAELYNDEESGFSESLIKYKKELLKLTESSNSSLNKLINEFTSLKSKGWEVSITKTSAPQNSINNKLNESPTFSEDSSDLDNGIELNRKEYTILTAIMNDGSIIDSNGLSNNYKSLSEKGVNINSVDFILNSTYIEFDTTMQTDLKPTNSINVQIYKKQI